MGFDLDPIAQISPSSAADLLSCPARAARKRGLGERAPRTTAAAIGNAAHDLTAQVHSGHFDGVPDAEIDDLIQREWNAAVGRQQAELEARAGTGQVPPPHRWRGYRIAEASLTIFLTDQVKRRQAGEAAEVVAVEEWLESDDKVFGGRVDVVTRDSRGDHVIDLKSGILPDEGLSPSHMVQLTLYAHLWDEATGVLPADIAVQQIDGALRVRPLHRSEVDTLCRELKVAQERANQAIGQGASSDELATPSEAGCRWCNLGSRVGILSHPLWWPTADWYNSDQAKAHARAVAEHGASEVRSFDLMTLERHPHNVYAWLMS